MIRIINEFKVKMTDEEEKEFGEYVYNVLRKEKEEEYEYGWGQEQTFVEYSNNRGVIESEWENNTMLTRYVIQRREDGEIRVGESVKELGVVDVYGLRGEYEEAEEDKERKDWGIREEEVVTLDEAKCKMGELFNHVVGREENTRAESKIREKRVIEQLERDNKGRQVGVEVRIWVEEGYSEQEIRYINQNRSLDRTKEDITWEYLREHGYEEYEGYKIEDIEGYVGGLVVRWECQVMDKTFDLNIKETGVKWVWGVEITTNDLGVRDELREQYVFKDLGELDLREELSKEEISIQGVVNKVEKEIRGYNEMLVKHLESKRI